MLSSDLKRSCLFVGEIKVSQQQTYCEQRSAEERSMLDQFRIARLPLVHQFILGKRSEILSETVPYEFKVSRDMVDDGAEA